MTDEELSHTTMAELLEQNDRLRAENRRLVRLAIRSEELARWHENFELASELRAAIEGK